MQAPWVKERCPHYFWGQPQHSASPYPSSSQSCPGWCPPRLGLSHVGDRACCNVSFAVAALLESCHPILPLLRELHTLVFAGLVLLFFKASYLINITLEILYFSIPRSSCHRKMVWLPSTGAAPAWKEFQVFPSPTTQAVREALQKQRYSSEECFKTHSNSCKVCTRVSWFSEPLWVRKKSCDGVWLSHACTYTSTQARGHGHSAPDGLTSQKEQTHLLRQEELWEGQENREDGVGGQKRERSPCGSNSWETGRWFAAFHQTWQEERLKCQNIPRIKNSWNFKTLHFGSVRCQAGLASPVTSPGGSRSSTSSAVAKVMGWAPWPGNAVSAEETPVPTCSPTAVSRLGIALLPRAEQRGLEAGEGFATSEGASQSKQVPMNPSWTKSKRFVLIRHQTEKTEKSSHLDEAAWNKIFNFCILS